MLISELCDKVIGIWGLGREGNAVWDYLKKHNIGKEIKVFTNDDEVNLNGVDVVIKSPGVSMYKPEIIEAKKNGVKFTSSSDLFLSEMRANKPNCKVIGISGSKGKSTSVSAMHHMLSAMGYKVGLGGNIGRPIIELLDDDYDYGATYIQGGTRSKGSIETDYHTSSTLNMQSSGYTLTKGKTYKTLINTQVDELFIVTEKMNIYILPIDKVDNKSTINLCDKYQIYKIN